MLADDLTEPVANLETGTVAVAICTVGRKLIRIGRRRRTRIRSDLLDRADSDAIRLAQSTIDGSGLRDPHLGAADEKRNVGRVGIAVADETGGIFGRVDRCLEDETIRRRITQRIYGFDMDTAASLATCEPKQTRVGYVPVPVDNLKLACFDGEGIVAAQTLKVRNHARRKWPAYNSLHRSEVLLENFLLDARSLQRFARKSRLCSCHKEPLGCIAMSCSAIQFISANLGCQGKGCA